MSFQSFLEKRQIWGIFTEKWVFLGFCSQKEVCVCVCVGWGEVRGVF